MEVVLDLSEAEPMTEAMIAMSTLKERYLWAANKDYPILTLPALSMDGFTVGEFIKDTYEPDSVRTYQITAFGTIGWTQLVKEGTVVAYLGETNGYLPRDRWMKSN